MRMPPTARKAMLMAHVGSSVGSFGAVVCFLVLAVAGLHFSDGVTEGAAYVAMDLTARLVVVPLVIAALVTGVAQSLGTHWGLLRHWWVVAKLVLTVFVLGVLLVQMPGIAHLASVAAETGFVDGALRIERISPVLHASGGLLVLLLPLGLSIYKPRGLTRYGWRKLHEGRAVTE